MELSFDRGFYSANIVFPVTQKEMDLLVSVLPEEPEGILFGEVQKRLDRLSEWSGGKSRIGAVGDAAEHKQMMKRVIQRSPKCGDTIRYKWMRAVK